MQKQRFFIEKENVDMIKAGIIGATGYAGGELVRFLLGHKDAEIASNGTVPEAMWIRNMQCLPEYVPDRGCKMSG